MICFKHVLINISFSWGIHSALADRPPNDVYVYVWFLFEYLVSLSKSMTTLQHVEAQISKFYIVQNNKSTWVFGDHFCSSQLFHTWEPASHTCRWHGRERAERRAKEVLQLPHGSSERGMCAGVGTKKSWGMFLNGFKKQPCRIKQDGSMGRCCRISSYIAPTT